MEKQAGALTVALKSSILGLRTGIASAKMELRGLGNFVKTNAAQFRMLGMGAAAAGGIISVAMGYAVKSAADVEKAYADIKAVSDELKGGSEEAAAAMKRVEEVAEELGKATKFSTKEVAEGMKFVAMAGYDVNEMLTAMPGLVNLAAAADQDLAFAADALTNILSGFGETANETNRFVDVMAATAANANVNLQEVAEAMKYVAPAAKDMGFNVEKTAAMIGKLGDAGIKGSMAGRNLRMAFIAWMKLEAGAFTKAQAEVMDRYKESIAGTGVTFEEFVGKVKSGEISFQDFIKGMREGGAKTGEFSQIFGSAASTMITVLADQSAAVVEFTGYLDEAKGAAQEMADIKLQTFAGQWDVLKGSIQTFAASIGKILLPFFIDMLKKGTAIVNNLMEWTKKNPVLTGILVKFLAVLGPILIALGALMILLPSLVTIAPAVGTAFTIMTGPIGIIITAIGAAVAAFLYFYTTNKKFANFVNTIGAWMKALGQNIWQYAVWIKDNWGRIWATIFMGIYTIAKNGFDNLITVFKWVWDWIKGWGSYVGKNFLNIWRNLFTAVGTAIKNFGKNILEQLKWIGEKMKPQNWFKKIEKPEWKPLLEGFEAVWEEMPEIAELHLKKLTEGLVSFIEPLPALIKPVLKAVVDGAEKGKKAIEGIKTATSSYIGTFDKLLKLRGKGKELTEEEKKVAKELEEVQKAALDEIAATRATSFEEWQAQNEARTEELYAELATQKQIEKDAKDEIADIRTTSFEDWKAKNEARTKELYAELATQKQIQQDAKDEIAEIRTMSFEDWQEKNEARTEELYNELAMQKQIQEDAKSEIADIRKLSFEDWKKKNEARTKELYAELAKQKQIQRDAKDEILDIRKMSFEDWQEKNKARTKELYEELAISKQIEKDAKDEIIDIRKMSFADWQKKNKTRTKELYAELAKQKKIEQDAKKKIADLRKMSFADWQKKNKTRTKELFAQLDKQKKIEQDAKREIADIEEMSFEDWQKKNEARTEELYEELAKQKQIQQDAKDEIAAIERMSFWEWKIQNEARTRELWDELEKQKALHQSMWTDIVNLTRDALTDIASEAKTMGEAFGDVAEKIKTMLSDALWSAAGAAMATGNVIGGVLLGLGSILVSVLGGTRVSEFQQAWEEFGENLKEVFAEVGLAISETIEEAQANMARVLQSQVDLEASTRDKLIAELDKYYDYRDLKEMSFAELVELAAKTREEIELGTIEVVEESEKEAAERAKDAKIKALQAIIDAHDKEQKMIDYKILLLKVEMKQLESMMLLEQARAETNLEKKEELRLASVAAAEEAMRMLEELETYWDETTESTEAATEATEAYGEAGKTATEKIEEGLAEMKDEIVGARGELGRFAGDMSRIRAPSITIPVRFAYEELRKFQTGLAYVRQTMPVIVHEEEAILNPAEAKEWREGKGREGEEGAKTVVEQHIEIKSLIPPDDPVLYDRIWREGMRAAKERDEERRVS